MRRVLRFLVCASLLAALAACGNKGDLVKPGDAPAKGGTAAAGSARP